MGSEMCIRDRLYDLGATNQETLGFITANSVQPSLPPRIFLEVTCIRPSACSSVQQTCIRPSACSSVQPFFYYVKNMVQHDFHLLVVCIPSVLEQFYRRTTSVQSSDVQFAEFRRTVWPRRGKGERERGGEKSFCITLRRKGELMCGRHGRWPFVGHCERADGVLRLSLIHI